MSRTINLGDESLMDSTIKTFYRWIEAIILFKALLLSLAGSNAKTVLPDTFEKNLTL
jgi:hypothetical protein